MFDPINYDRDSLNSAVIEYDAQHSCSEKSIVVLRAERLFKG